MVSVLLSPASRPTVGKANINTSTRIADAKIFFCHIGPPPLSNSLVSQDFIIYDVVIYDIIIPLPPSRIVKVLLRFFPEFQRSGKKVRKLSNIEG